jgi:hypothetical protein
MAGAPRGGEHLRDSGSRPSDLFLKAGLQDGTATWPPRRSALADRYGGSLVGFGKRPNLPGVLCNDLCTRAGKTASPMRDTCGTPDISPAFSPQRIGTLTSAFTRGAGWTRTSDLRIMSPLLPRRPYRRKVGLPDGAPMMNWNRCLHLVRKANA